jgi:hypothetical protein
MISSHTGSDSSVLAIGELLKDIQRLELRYEDSYFPQRLFLPFFITVKDCKNILDSIKVFPFNLGPFRVGLPIVVNSTDGSSPRSWGTRHSLEPNPVLPRFIPTLVGNTASAASPVEPSTVHPHARGEHAFEDIKIASKGGSSPRSWGTLTQ